MSSLLARPEPIIPTGEISRLAGQSLRALRQGAFDLGEGQTGVRMETLGGEATLAMPAAVVDLLVEILARLSERRPVALIPEDAHLSVPEAADLLNVSKPYLAGLLNSGEIASTGEGALRQVVYRDVAAYKARSDARGRLAIDELAGLSQEMGLG